MSFYSAGMDIWNHIILYTWKINRIDTKEHGKKRKRKQ